VGEIFQFLRNQHRFGKVTKTHVVSKKYPILGIVPYLWDELEACKKRPCKVYLDSEIQSYITLHNPTPPKPSKRSVRRRAKSVSNTIRQNGGVRGKL